MRSLLEIGRRENMEEANRFGLAVLRGLGATTPEESGYAPHALPQAIGAAEQLADPVWETARRICRIVSQEIGMALQGNVEVGEDPDADARTPFAIRLEAAESDLMAPGLARLSVEELGSVVLTVTALAADPGGNCNDGPYVHELDENLGRWSRRKIRKALGAHSVREIQAIDYEAWRDEIRLDAACAALDSGEGDLRDALIQLSGRTMEDAVFIPDSADISSLVAGSSLARRLLARVVDGWCALMTGRDR
jgi:hypothetical protein